MTDSASMLEFQGITAGYGRSTVLRDLTFAVPSGQVVGCLGANGVGKTTMLRVAAGLIRPRSGRLVTEGRDITKAAPHDRAKAGLCLIPEGRGIFRSLTVAENLRIHQPSWVHGQDALNAALDAFPVLAKRRNQQAGSMSGGEQQMLALARAWLASPKLVMVDEASMGLSPRIVDVVFSALRTLADRGTTLLIVEQYVNIVLDLADLVLVLDKTGVRFYGKPADLNTDELAQAYLGHHGDDQRVSLHPHGNETGAVGSGPAG
jgi:branched-chain amino acid transport system ATP-binding protein